MLRRLLSGWSCVCLADMPFIQLTYRQLIEAFKTEAKSRAFSFHLSIKTRHPVLFGSEHFRAMQLLQGDEGAKTVLSTSQQCSFCD